MNKNEQWITEKCGTNITPPNPPKKPSIGNKTLRKIKSKSRVKALEEENEALKAQRDTYINLMNIYKNISKGRQDSKNVTDYIERLEQKLKIVKTQMKLARDIAYDSSQSEPVRVQIDEILTEALKQMEEVNANI